MRTATIRWCWEHHSTQYLREVCEWARLAKNGVGDCDITGVAIAEIVPYIRITEWQHDFQPTTNPRGFDGAAMDYHPKSQRLTDRLNHRNTNPLTYTTADTARLDELA